MFAGELAFLGIESVDMCRVVGTGEMMPSMQRPRLPLRCNVARVWRKSRKTAGKSALLRLRESWSLRGC